MWPHHRGLQAAPSFQLWALGLLPCAACPSRPYALLTPADLFPAAPPPLPLPLLPLPPCLLQFQCYCEKIWYSVVRCRVVDAQGMPLPVPWWVGRERAWASGPGGGEVRRGEARRGAQIGALALLTPRLQPCCPHAVPPSRPAPSCRSPQDYLFHPGHYADEPAAHGTALAIREASFLRSERTPKDVKASPRPALPRWRRAAAACDAETSAASCCSDGGTSPRLRLFSNPSDFPSCWLAG